MPHGLDQSDVKRADADAGPISRHCLPTDASASTDADASHGSTRDGRNLRRGVAASSESLVSFVGDCGSSR